MKRPDSGASELGQLRRAWQLARGEDGEGAAEVPADRVWRAVAGELPPREVRDLAEAAARDPELARSWVLARELHDGASGAERGLVVPFRRRPAARRWALAAVLVAGLGVAFWVLPGSQAGPRLRGDGPVVAIAARTAEGAELSRREFVLRWSPLPSPETRYTLRVTTGALDPVAEVSGIAAAEYRLGAEQLAGIADGSTLFWQVDAHLPDGRTVTSPAFAVVLRE